MAFGIIALFLSNIAFAFESGTVASSSEVIKKDNMSLYNVVKITIRRQTLTMAQKIKVTNKMFQQNKPAQEIINNILKDIEYLEPCIVEIQELRDKAEANVKLAREEKEKLNEIDMPRKQKRKIRHTLDIVIDNGNTMIVSLDDQATLLTGSKDLANVGIANARAQLSVNK